MKTKINAEWAKSKGFDVVQETCNLPNGESITYDCWEGDIDGLRISINSSPSDGKYCSTINTGWFYGNEVPCVHCWLDTEERMMKAIDFCKNFYK